MYCNALFVFVILWLNPLSTFRSTFAPLALINSDHSVSRRLHSNKDFIYKTGSFLVEQSAARRRPYLSGRIDNLEEFYTSGSNIEFPQYSDLSRDLYEQWPPAPTVRPSVLITKSSIPSHAPSISPTAVPTSSPTTLIPSFRPSNNPTSIPSHNSVESDATRKYQDASTFFTYIYVLENLCALIGIFGIIHSSPRILL